MFTLFLLYTEEDEFPGTRDRMSYCTVRITYVQVDIIEWVPSEGVLLHQDLVFSIFIIIFIMKIKRHEKDI